jgi:hypothetical protein
LAPRVLNAKHRVLALASHSRSALTSSPAFVRASNGMDYCISALFRARERCAIEHMKWAQIHVAVAPRIRRHVHGTVSPEQAAILRPAITYRTARINSCKRGSANRRRSDPRLTVLPFFRQSARSRTLIVAPHSRSSRNAIWMIQNLVSINCIVRNGVL